MTIRVKLLSVATAAVAGAALTLPGSATAAVGSLAYQGCITGKTQAGPAGSGACSAIASAASVGASSGLNGPSSVAATSDGKSVYVVSSLDHAIARFDRNPSTGVLTYQGCLTGSTDGPGASSCTPISTAGAGGANSGMYDANAVAVSVDGASVYVTSFSDSAVARFTRDTGTGALTYQGCVTGSSQAGPGPTGSGACTGIPSMKPGGFTSGLLHPSDIAVTPDGGSVVVTAYDDDALAVFSRNTGSGALTYQGCITGEVNVSSTGACTAWAGATDLAGNSGLDSPVAVAVNPGSSGVYVTTELDDSIARFPRDTGTGAVSSSLLCVSGETATAAGPCAQVPAASGSGGSSGIDGPTDVATGPAGDFAYVASEFDDSVTGFEFSAGALVHRGCFSGETQSAPACALAPTASSSGINSGLDGPQAVTAIADGRSLYASTFYGSVARFKRNTTTGALEWGDCVTGNTVTAACAPVAGATGAAANSGLDQLSGIAGSADSTSVYTVSNTDDSVAGFRRSLTDPPADPEVVVPFTPPVVPAPPPVACRKGQVKRKGKCVKKKKRRKGKRK